MNKKIVYVGALILFVGLALFYDRVQLKTESDLNNLDDPNTQYVIEAIESNPLHSDGQLAGCIEESDTAQRNRTGWPLTLYENAKEVPCGRSSGVSHPTKRNQLLNTGAAAVLSFTVFTVSIKLMSKRG